jgi:uncharacterized protein YsxB (DUF464 family)
MPLSHSKEETMVKVVYHRELNRVSLTGHAQSDEKGKDLICASASILAYTLADYVKKAEEENRVWCSLTYLEEGDAIISCSPNEGKSDAITIVFDAICRGFELLARHYPDNISYETR